MSDTATLRPRARPLHLHILGICGTFMGGLALLARALGHRVSGSDHGCYAPMADQLREAGITVADGYHPAHLQPPPDLVLVGNALSRGNPAVEHVLDQRIAYRSGPQWLADEVLAGRRVLAVAGTHGKTTTTSMLAWILDCAGIPAGFLVGGVPENFGHSARLGDSEWFVIEADEYDSAFFDKRSKFVHYRPERLVITNVEFDHADIFPDLAAIELQFHHLLRTVPSSGLIVHPQGDPAIERILARGCWTPCTAFGTGPGAPWRVRPLQPDAGAFAVEHEGRPAGTVHWQLFGMHNALNALAAVAVAAAAGVPPVRACAALDTFRAPKRRLEALGCHGGVHVYDDFAHHPTAIAATIAALRARIGERRIVAVLEPRSNTMRMGVHREQLAAALAEADAIFVYRPPGLPWDLDAALAPLAARCRVLDRHAALAEAVVAAARPGDRLLVMSNGDFGGLPADLLRRLSQRGPAAAPA